MPWAITFHSEFAARNVGTPLNMPLHPTQLYEAGRRAADPRAAARHRAQGRPFPGRTFWGYMLLYGISRFIIEFYRGDVRGTIGMFSTSQFVSLLIVPLSIVMLVILAGASGLARPRHARRPR